MLSASLSADGGEPKVIGSIQRPVAGGFNVSQYGWFLLYSQAS